MKFLMPLVLGIFAAIGALVAELAVIIIFASQNSGLNDFVGQLTVILAAAIFIEEAVKFLVIHKNSARLTKPGGIFTQALLVGLGFALTEAWLKPWGEILSQFYLYIGLFGLFTTHLATSSLFAWATAKMRGQEKVVIAGTALALAFGVHLLYNSLLIYNAPPWMVYLYLSLQLLLIAGSGRYFFRQKTATAAKFAK